MTMARQILGRHDSKQCEWHWNSKQMKGFMNRKVTLIIFAKKNDVPFFSAKLRWFYLLSFMYYLVASISSGIVCPWFLSWSWSSHVRHITCWWLVLSHLCFCLFGEVIRSSCKVLFPIYEQYHCVKVWHLFLFPFLTLFALISSWNLRENCISCHYSSR